MFDNLLRIIAPHHCYSCDQVGHVLCHSCIKNIQDESPSLCLVCQKPTNEQLCKACRNSSPYEAMWYVGERDGVLKQLIDDLKFSRKREIHYALARLLHEAVPILPNETVVVPISTIVQHRRQRGYDHAALIAKEFAKLRGYHYSPVLLRRNHTVQVGASAIVRRAQANDAFLVAKKLDAAPVYLVIDDIYTTGATLQAAAGVLRDAGGRHIVGAVVARQPLN